MTSEMGSGITVELISERVRWRHHVSGLNPISESSMNRIMSHYEGPGFIVVTADRSERSPQENRDLAQELQRKITSAGYGYIPIVGGYVETDMDTGEKVRVADEESFLVPNAPYGGKSDEGFDTEHLKALGQRWAMEYDQEAILWCPPGGPVQFVSPTGEVLQYGPAPTMSSLVLDDPEQPFFSSLRKGSHRGRPFSYLPDENDIAQAAEGVEREVAFFLRQPPSEGGGLKEARSRYGEIFVRCTRSSQQA